MIRDDRDSHRHRTNQPRRQTMTEQPEIDHIPSQTILALADVLAVHGRVNPPGGNCYCGHEVPLGRRFSAHQVRALLDSEPGRAMLAERERQARAEALREAAGEMQRVWVVDRTTLGMATDDWLRERADRTESEAGR